MAIIALYLAMVFIGYQGAKRINKNPKWTDKVQTVCLFLLIFTMGARIGADEKVIASLGTIGLTAFAITLAALIGSVLFCFLARKLLGFSKEGSKG